jgi:hypothetical protein
VFLRLTRKPIDLIQEFAELDGAMAVAATAHPAVMSNAGKQAVLPWRL